MNRNKKLFAVLTLVCFMFTLLPISAFAETEPVTSGKCGDDAIWVFEDGVLTISGTGSMYDYEWGSASRPWVNFIGEIKTIEIMEGITSLGKHALQGCTVNKIVLPESMERLEEGSLGGIWITDITIPANVNEIHELAFINCSDLKEINVVEENEFYKSIDGVLYTADMKTLLLFPQAKNCEVFIIPDGVEELGDDGLRYGNFKSLKIPASLKDTENHLFLTDGENLKEYVVDEDNTKYQSVDGVLFSKDMTKLWAYPTAKDTEVYTVPDGVERIVKNAICNIESLKNIHLPASLVNIDYIPAGYGLGGVFGKGCSNLETIIVDSANINYSSEDGVLFDKNKETLIFSPENNPTTEYKTPSTVKEIRHYAFSGSNNLSSIVLTDSVKKVDYYAFGECENLECIELNNGLEEIGHTAFYGCSNLFSLKIPEGVKKIGAHAFSYCDILKYISFPESLEELDELYFEVSHDIDNLTDIYYAGTEEQWKAITMWDEVELIMDGLRENGTAVHFEQSGIPNDSMVHGNCDNNLSWKLDFTTNTLTISGIGEMQSFERGEAPWYDYRSMIETVVVEEGVSSIGEYAFWGCKEIKEVKIPLSMLEIQYYAFTNYEATVDVYYSGSKLDWDSIDIRSYNNMLKKATIHYAVEVSENPVLVGNSYVEIPEIVYSCDELAVKMKLLDQDGNPTTEAQDVYFWLEKDGERIYFPEFHAYQVINNLSYNSELKYFALKNALYGERIFIYFNENGEYTIHYSFDEPKLNGDTLVADSMGQQTVKVIDNHNCGDGVTWSIEGTVLTLSGTGEVTRDTWEIHEDEITKVVIEDGVIVSWTIFANMDNLQSFSVSSDNENYSVLDGVLYDKDATTLIVYPSGKTTAIYTMPETLEEIDCLLSSAKFEELNVPATLQDSKEILTKRISSNYLKKIEVSSRNLKYSSLDGVLYNKDGTILITYPSKKTDVSFKIPDDVITIKGGVFSSHEYLKELIIPSSVSDIELEPIPIACLADNMVNITVEQDNPKYYSVDGVLYEKLDEGNRLVLFPNNKNMAIFTVPEGVVEIYEHAFWGNNYLQQIILPNGIKTLGQGCFEGFEVLNAVYIPATVTEIGSHLFLDSNKLTDIYYGGTEEQWDELTTVSDSIKVHFNATGIPEDSDDSNSGDSGNDGGNAGSAGSISSGFYYVPDNTPDAEVISPNEEVKITVKSITTSTLNDVKDIASDDDNLFVIGGKDSAVQISAKEDGKALDSFTQPVSVTVEVSKSALKDVEDVNKLTLALVTTDENGNTTLEYVGGTYDSKADSFTAYTDKPGDYVLVEKQDIVKMDLFIGNFDSTINGATVANDVAPYIANDRTMVPVAFIMNHLGCQVDWFNDERKVVITLPDGEQLSMIIDQEIPGFGAVPVIVNDRTMVPIAYIAYAMDAHVLWVEAEQRVVIVK